MVKLYYKCYKKYKRDKIKNKINERWNQLKKEGVQNVYKYASCKQQYGRNILIVQQYTINVWHRLHKILIELK